MVGALADAVGLALAAFGLAGVGVLAATTLLLFVRETLQPPPIPPPEPPPVPPPEAPPARAPAEA